MSSRRQLMMIVAIVFAALAAASVYAFLGNANRDNISGSELVKVYVLQSDIVKLDPGSKVVAALELEKIPLKDLPEGRVTEADSARLEEFKNQVAAYDLRKGQIFVDSMVVDQALINNPASFRVDKNMVAVSISVDDVHGVGGNLVPGDYVNILTNYTPIDNDNRTPWDDTKVTYTTMLYQKVKILYIGTTPVPQPGDSTGAASNNGAAAPAPVASSGTITFEVPPEAASRIVNAASGGGSGGGGITLALVNPQYEPIDVPTIAAVVDIGARGIQQQVQGSVGKTPYPNNVVPK